MRRLAKILSIGAMVVSGSALSAVNKGAFVGSFGLGYAFLPKAAVVVKQGGSVIKTFDKAPLRPGVFADVTLGYRLARGVSFSFEISHYNANATGLSPDGDSLGSLFSLYSMHVTPMIATLGYDHTTPWDKVRLKLSVGVGANFIAGSHFRSSVLPPHPQAPLHLDTTLGGFSALGALGVSYALSSRAFLGLRYRWGYDKVELRFKEYNDPPPYQTSFHQTLITHAVTVVSGFAF